MDHWLPKMQQLLHIPISLQYDHASPCTSKEITIYINTVKYARFVEFLEDRHIRAIPIEQRETLRLPKDASNTTPSWKAAYSNYLTSVLHHHKPSIANDPLQSVTVESCWWICQKAIAELYFDDVVESPTIQGVDLQHYDKETSCYTSRFPLGFSTGSENVDQYATHLKMVYIQDMRHLQDDINAIVDRCQDFTAEAKTDQKLGKVGR